MYGLLKRCAAAVMTNRPEQCRPFIKRPDFAAATPVPLKPASVYAQNQDHLRRQNCFNVTAAPKFI
jgi:hypothetical protein